MTKNRIQMVAAVLAGATALCAGGALAADELPAREREQARREMERARQEVEKARTELQRATRELARSMAALDRDNPRAQYFEYITNPRRAMLGIIIDDDPERGDARGVRVLAITPGGGAEKAGLKAGDLMLSLNGRPLAAEEGAPAARKLREALRELKAGDAAKVEFERGGRRQTATVTTTAPQEDLALALPALPDLQDLEDLEHFMPKMPLLGFRSPALRGLELARLDPDLAWYFKTQDGVLVVKAPKSDLLPLKSGDVIQTVDGEAVSEPITVIDKLHGRGEARAVRLEVQRQGRRVELEGRIEPARAMGERRRTGEPASRP